MATRRHFTLFDSLRGLAVLSVIGFHVAALTGRLGEGAAGRVLEVLGGQAVIVFFVISGFLLYRPYLAARAAGHEPPATGTFLRRRVFRIVPAYWVILTVLAIFPGIVGAFGDDWWRYYGFLQLYSDETVLRGIPVAWTLCVEVTYYLLLPLWAAAVRALPSAGGRWARTELLALGVVAGGGFAIQLLAARQEVGRTLANTLLGQFPWMAIGMALALASVLVAAREERNEPAPGWAAWVERRSGVLWAIGLIALVGLAALVPEGGLLGLIAAVTSVRPLDNALAHIGLSGLLAAVYVLPAVFGEHAGGLPRRILALAPVAWIGTVSYSMYLWHLTLAQLIWLPRDPGHFSASGLGLQEHVGGGSTVVLFVVTVAAAALASVVTYYGIERPFIRRSHRGPGADRPAPAAPEPRQAASGA